MVNFACIRKKTQVLVSQLDLLLMLIFGTNFSFLSSLQEMAIHYQRKKFQYLQLQRLFQPQPRPQQQEIPPSSGPSQRHNRGRPPPNGPSRGQQRVRLPPSGLSREQQRIRPPPCGPSREQQRVRPPPRGPFRGQQRVRPPPYGPSREQQRVRPPLYGPSREQQRVRPSPCGPSRGQQRVRPSARGPSRGQQRGRPRIRSSPRRDPQRQQQRHKQTNKINIWQGFHHIVFQSKNNKHNNPHLIVFCKPLENPPPYDLLAFEDRHQPEPSSAGYYESSPQSSSRGNHSTMLNYHACAVPDLSSHTFDSDLENSINIVLEQIEE